jgi:cellulose synthase/poly-beta-1,6-N-acetylglucosamine synthase-like glycosyltransferase
VRGLANSFIVTIGFCVKDVETVIRTAIKSILDQDFPHETIELIVVEGFSRDQTFTILKNMFSATDIQCRIFRDNEGLGAARQTVVDNARGRYIVWVDGDMNLPRDYVRNQVKFMEKNPSVGIAAGKYGLLVGQGVVADLENIVYAVDSVYGERGGSKFGRLPGTEGSIFRVDAIRESGGFDVNIKGAAEDTDLAYRIISRGWKVTITDEFFTESTRPSLISLWQQYFWYGYGGHFIYNKDPEMLTFWKMTPPAGFVAGLVRCPGAYRLTGHKVVFLLPIHYTFKRIAWLIGFLDAHFKEYCASSKLRTQS